MDAILTKIMAIMATTNSSLEESFFEAVLQRLDSLGYTAIDGDELLICFSAQKVENNIKNSCNVLLIPDGLFNVAVDMVYGDFLSTKKGLGGLTGFDFGVAVKSIQEGDTNITFVDGLSAEQQFDKIIGDLRSPGESKFVSFRKMKW